ncbi:uncharacterized protein J8A68_002440, partial [[Candida] subhashii]
MFTFAKRLVDRLEGNPSRDDSSIDDSYFKNASQINNKGYALRVLHVVPHSTSHTHGIEAWFDYIIRINNHELPMLNPALSSYSYSINDDGTINYGGAATEDQAAAIDYDLLAQEIETLAKHESELVIDVWSAKGGIIRSIQLPLEPSSDASTNEDKTVEKLFVNRFKSLGLTLQSQHLNTSTYVWRILKTHQGSPAFLSQLVPNSDYIIGCDSAFPGDSKGKGLLYRGGESLLSKTVMNYYNHHYSIAKEDNIPITLYVYNHDYDILRPVTVNLSRNWGTGQHRGILGCDVGYGFLHRIPEVIGKFENNSIVEDVLFETKQAFAYDENQKNLPQTSSFVEPISPSPVVPENSINQIPPAIVPTSISQPPSPVARRKKHHPVSNTALSGLNDYMNEELAKSKEKDDQG